MKKIKFRNHRFYAFFLFLGAGLLLFLTIRMIYQGALNILVFWVSLLLVLELLIDLSWLICSLKWWKTNKNMFITLRLAAAAIIVHALRVLIFALGRIGPWIDFDVRVKERTMHASRWSWDWLCFAVAMSTLSVVVLIIIWRSGLPAKFKNDN